MYHEMTYRVPYADTDRMGVVYHANYLVYFERGRNEMLRDAGLPYSEMDRRGVIFPVSEAFCRYHAPARYDDLKIVRLDSEVVEACKKFIWNEEEAQ